MTEVVAEKILDIIASEARLDRANLKLTDKLDDLGIESLEKIEIAFRLEEEYDIYIPSDNADFRVETLQDFVDVVKTLAAENSTPNT